MWFQVPFWSCLSLDIELCTAAFLEFVPSKANPEGEQHPAAMLCPGGGQAQRKTSCGELWEFSVQR